MKKNKKKNQRSKASRKRNAHKKVNRERRGGHKKRKADVIHCDVTDENMPTIDQVPAGIPAKRLGSANRPGFLALLVLRYVVSLEKRILSGEEIKPYSLIQFRMSELDLEEDPARKQKLDSPVIIGTGRLCVENIDLMTSDRLDEICIDLEGSIRDLVAQFNEEGPWTVRSVFLDATEMSEEIDVNDASNFAPNEAEIDKRYEKRISL